MTSRWAFGCVAWVFGIGLAVALSAQAQPAPGTQHVLPQCPWVTSKAPVAQRVEQLMARMTLAQKLAQLHGVRGSGYAGEVPGVPSLCIPALTMQDGPGGVGDNLHGVTQLPAPVALAATWDRTLAHRYGEVVGQEERGKGVAVNLGPTINIVRDPRWGRAFESYGEDPYLNGQMGVAYVRGVQATGVMAQLKHVALYNQETNRNTPDDNVIVSRRAMHALYLPAFKTVVKEARPASMMCSYNRINGVDACQDAYLLQHVLRGRFGFRGFVVSDWGGTHDTVGPAKAGMSMEMPDGRYYGDALRQALKHGQVSVAQVDELLRPVLTQMFRFHLFEHPPQGTPETVVTTPAHVALAQTVAEQGTVLLKNADHLLPLSATKVHSIAVIGSDAGAGAVTVGGGSAHVDAGSIITPFQGIVARAGGELRVRYAQGDTPAEAPPALPARYLTPASGKGHGLTGQYFANGKLSGTPKAVRNARDIDFDWQGKPPVAGMPADAWSARWVGTLTPPQTGRYTLALTSDDGSRLRIDGHTVIDNWGDHASTTKTATVELVAGHSVRIEVDYYQMAGGASLRLGWQVPNPPRQRQQARLARAVKLAAVSDVAVVFASDFQTEGSDLSNLDLPGNQDQLIAAVAAANPHTIVVLNTGSAVLMPWLSSVKAVLEAWYPGQQDGRAIAAVLFGDVDPSGKLPVTFPRRLADVPAATMEQWPGVGGRILYSEGDEVGYRWYDAKHVEPLFAFGHGLSYTKFEFSHLDVHLQDSSSAGHIGVGVSVSNTGKREGTEVVQMYVRYPEAAHVPPKQLKGFARVRLKPGQTRRIELRLPIRALAVWNGQANSGKVIAGTYRIMLGSASDQLPLKADVLVHGMVVGPRGAGELPHG